MTEDDWLGAVQARAATPLIHPMDPISTARSLLVGAYLFAGAAPADVLVRFSAVPDRTIQGLLPAQIARFHQGDFALRLAPNVDIDSAFLAHFVMIRALDAFLAETQLGHGTPSDPERAWNVSSDRGDAFLIPRVVSREASASGRRAGQGSFVFRALIWHRILPTVVGDYRVRLCPAEVDVGRGEGPVTFGGALFRALDLGEDPGQPDNRFLISEVRCADQPDVVDMHLARAHAEACSVLTFPELTIAPSLRDQIRDTLRTGIAPADADAVPWTLPLVVAGSWHETADGSWRNVATIFDGYGKEVARHAKIFPYVDESGRLEAIASGDALTVLVTEDALLAIGICRDFCERGVGQNPYSLLDVDVFLITSFGDGSTMAGHFQTATDVQIRFRAQVFITQQTAANTEGVLGFIYAPTERPLVDFRPTVRTELWNTVSAHKPSSPLDRRV